MKARDQVAKLTSETLEKLFAECEVITDDERAQALMSVLACASAWLHALAGRDALAEAFTDLYSAAGAAEVLQSTEGGTLQ